MRAKYTGQGGTIVVELVGEAVGDRELRARRNKDLQVPDGFIEAFRAAADASRARALPDKREAFLAILQDMKSKGFELLEISSEQGVHMEIDMATGRTMTRGAAVSGANQGLMESLAAGVARALRGLLVTQPDKLRAALDENDPQAFVDALSPRAVKDVQVLEAALAATTDALSREEWAKYHSDIRMGAGLMAVASRATSQGRDLLRNAIDSGHLSPESRATARLAIANSHAGDRRFDVAASAYRALLDGDEKPSPENLAWVYANLGRALLELGRVDEAIENFRRAAAHRAKLGLEGEPYATQCAAASQLERFDVRRALVLYDEVAATLDTRTEFSRSQKGNALLRAARIRCLDLGAFDEALRDLAAARTLLGELFEDSEGIASALGLEMHCFQAKGDEAGAARAAAERAAFLSDRPQLKGDQAERALKGEPKRQTGAEDETIPGRVALMQGFDELEKLQGPAFFDKIEQLASETLHQNDDEKHYLTGVVLSLGGDRLTSEGKKDLALEYYLRAVAAHPASFDHRVNVGQCLLNLGRFQEAVEVGLRLAVDDPDSFRGFLICGAAGYRTADYALADQMLREALQRNPDHALAKDLLAKTEEERLKLTLQGQPVPPMLVRTFSPTTHAAFLDYLRDFAKRARLNSDSFWKKRSEEKLVQNPESAGRALLAQDITATCRAVAIYKETILAGGRIDLIMNVLGSEFITELKICGAGYSRGWAEGGFEQIKQYTRERGATRAYLVVFDARADQDGDNALPSSADVGDGMTVFCVAVNIRGMDK